MRDGRTGRTDGQTDGVKPIYIYNNQEIGNSQQNKLGGKEAYYSKWTDVKSFLFKYIMKMLHREEKL